MDTGYGCKSVVVGGYLELSEGRCKRVTCITNDKSCLSVVYEYLSKAHDKETDIKSDEESEDDRHARSRCRCEEV